MDSSLNSTDEHEHRPARSGTPTAWLTLIILTALILGGVFFDSIVSGMLRLGLTAIAWNQRVELSIGQLSLEKNGTIQAQGVSVYFGSVRHRSSWKSDSIEVRLTSIGNWLGFPKSKKNRFIREVVLGKTKLLLDRRTDVQDEVPEPDKAARNPRMYYAIPWMSLLPDAAAAGPLDLVFIGNTCRFSMTGLYFSLPDHWAGRVVYSEAMLDIGSAHQRFTAASIPAMWNGSTLRLGRQVLGKELNLEELTLTPLRGRLEFGMRGTIGLGLIRGDGSFSAGDSQSRFAVTLIGENLKMEMLSMLVKDGDQRASGTIRQGRFIFRGDLDKALEADSSLRIVADDFRWEGRGWDSLRLAATLTGRAFTLSELVLLQKENEVVAQGQSKLPEDWHKALKAPFTASFHARLEDAGALSALAGPDFAQLSGGLEFEGVLKGAENKAEGYCNLVSTGMRIRNLPVDWLKGCLLFEGERSRLSNLEAWSGKDRIVMEGSVENSRPHTYSATAQFDIRNLTKRLAQIGISTAAQIGGGAVQGTWSGDGSIKGHSGTFAAKVNDWISPWTQAGMSGSFEGSYSPGHLYLSKAEFQAQDLRLGLQLAASPTYLEAKSIMATRKGKTDPLVQGEVSVPVNAPALWQSGDLISNLGMKDPLDLKLELRGIKVEELADLLGQKTPFTGNLEGSLFASGTPESPEIHNALKISRLTMPNSTSTIDMTWAFDSSAGRATSLIVQDPVKDSPLMLKADIPFRWVADKGHLRFAELTAPVHAVATLHSVPISGWLSRWGGSAWMLRDGFMDGSLTLEGTLEQPAVKGDINLIAREAGFSGLPELNTVRLPIDCSLNRAIVSGGTALLGTNPVTLSGVLDWSNNPCTARLDFLGNDLTFPKVAGLESRGHAELALIAEGTNIPTLSGKLMINQIHGMLPADLTPSFVPPGIAFANTPVLFPSDQEASPVRLDLEIHTVNQLFISEPPATNPVEIQADFRLLGGLNDLRWTGGITARDYDLNLPAGRFVVPIAKLQSDKEGEQQLSFTAYGMTRQGYCTIQNKGVLQNSSLWVEMLAATPETTGADMMMELLTPEQTKICPIAQIPGWIRQNMLFPTPPIGWISRRDEVAAPESLGFYGRPWSMPLLQQSVQSPSLKEHPETSKN